MTESTSILLFWKSSLAKDNKWTTCDCLFKWLSLSAPFFSYKTLRYICPRFTLSVI